MGNTENIHITDDSFRELLDRYLNLSTLNNPKSEHLDQDTLSSFAEGSFSRRESTPIVSHLADCSFCRKITSELVRLDLALDGSTTDIAHVGQSSSKVSEVLSGFLARIFGSADSTDFAHQEPEKKVDDEDEEKVNRDADENK